MGGELASSVKFCTMLTEEFKIVLERAGSYSSWLNGKVERHNQTIEGMIRVGTVDHGLGKPLWYCKVEDTMQKYNATLHSTIKDVLDFSWYGKRPSIHDFRIFGCKVEARINFHLHKLDPRTDDEYFIGTAATKSVIRYWKPSDPNSIQYCITATFF